MTWGFPSQDDAAAGLEKVASTHKDAAVKTGATALATAYKHCAVKKVAVVHGRA
jgi:hypothetical protein